MSKVLRRRGLDETVIGENGDEDPMRRHLPRPALGQHIGALGSALVLLSGSALLAAAAWVRAPIWPVPMTLLAAIALRLLHSTATSRLRSPDWTGQAPCR